MTSTILLTKVNTFTNSDFHADAVNAAIQEAYDLCSAKLDDTTDITITSGTIAGGTALVSDNNVSMAIAMVAAGILQIGRNFSKDRIQNIPLEIEKLFTSQVMDLLIVGDPVDEDIVYYDNTPPSGDWSV